MVNTAPTLQVEAVITCLAKLAVTHDKHIRAYPELYVLEDALTGEIQENGEETDLLTMRLVYVLKVLNQGAKLFPTLALVRDNFVKEIQLCMAGIEPDHKQLYL